MNYFYTYMEGEQEVSSLQQMQTEIQRKNAVVCFFNCGSTAQWKQLQAAQKQSDILYIQGTAHLASEIQELKHRLSTLQKSGACVRLRDERSIDLEQMLQLIGFMTGTIRKRSYALQLEGVQKALEKKRNGEGSYDRPKMALPQGFEEDIRKIMRKEMKREDYQKQPGFKCSTYFKMVKELRDD